MTCFDRRKQIIMKRKRIKTYIIFAYIVLVYEQLQQHEERVQQDCYREAPENI